MPRTPRARA